jgi:hypothetical protein
MFLKPRLQNIRAKNIGAHKMHKQILKIYTNICSNKIKQNLLQKTGKTYCEIKLGRTYCKIIKILALA